ncbi:MFS transporter [Planotetraspora mira]|uniref:MFS transporter n=1 Tax=Planotetraspora mira TaxID=58121 RepID=A0A8J3TZR9_9ACTN|nr:MFS transporter [Planotetraspora mira]GII34272.1 MFS transporter [Planotetraspora mira]
MTMETSKTPESSKTKESPDAGPPLAAPDPRRWRALAVLGLIQFMLVLDLTIVNVALPRIQHALGFSGPGLAWVVNGYALMAGGLLLLGGRLADIYGRRRLFLAGVAVFALASAVSGAAAGAGMLVTGRFAQGVGEALAAPAALGLIALLFTDPGERAKALGVWGGLTGLGGIAGTIISGVLTDLASWRWIFFINLPVALVVLALVPRLVTESRMARDHCRLDLTGAVTATAGLVAIVAGLQQAATHPWGSWQVLAPLLGGIVLLAATVLVEARSTAPLIPPRFFADRTRVTANILSLLNTAAFFTFVFLLTLYEQQVLGYSPLQGGLSYVPFGVAIGAGIALGSALLPRAGVRALLVTSFLGLAAGLLITFRLDVVGSYVGGVLPCMLVVGLFTGMTFPALLDAALHGVTGEDSSVASAVQNTMQQVGGAIGLACLATLAFRQTGPTPSGATAVDGYLSAFKVAAAVLIVAATVALTLSSRNRTP